MSRLRVLVAFLLMLVLPVQSFAAASLVFCADHAADHASSATHSHQEHEGHPAAHDGAGPGTDHDHATAGQPAAEHGCAACASCCHSIGIADALPRTKAADTPASLSAEPPARIVNQPLPQPERPPRA